MIELEQNEVFEETEYDSIDLEGEGLGESEIFPRLTRANYVDRVRFTRIPNENRQIGSSEEPAASGDPLYIYYRSMSKIPLLTREEEVYLAKKIESAKINTLKLLSLTTINSFKIMELAEELQPTGSHVSSAQADTDEDSSDSEMSLEERTRIRIRRIRRIISRLEKLESKYRLARGRFKRGKPSKTKLNKDLGKIQSNREAIFSSLQRIDFSEDQMGLLVESVEDVLHKMEEAQSTVKRLSRTGRKRKELKTARARLRELESRYLTNLEELRKIVALISENKREMLDA